MGRLNPREMAKAAVAFIAVIFLRHVTPALFTLLFYFLAFTAVGIGVKAYDLGMIAVPIFCAAVALFLFQVGARRQRR